MVAVGVGLWACSYRVLTARDAYCGRAPCFRFVRSAGRAYFCLIFRGFIAVVTWLARIFLYVGPFSAVFLFLFLLRSWCDGDC